MVLSDHTFLIIFSVHNPWKLDSCFGHMLSLMGYGEKEKAKHWERSMKEPGNELMELMTETWNEWWKRTVT